jgi:hypothetical protein
MYGPKARNTSPVLEDVRLARQQDWEQSAARRKTLEKIISAAAGRNRPQLEHRPLRRSPNLEGNHSGCREFAVLAPRSGHPGK